MRTLCGLTTGHWHSGSVALVIFKVPGFCGPCSLAYGLRPATLASLCGSLRALACADPAACGPPQACGIFGLSVRCRPSRPMRASALSASPAASVTSVRSAGFCRLARPLLPSRASAAPASFAASAASARSGGPQRAPARPVRLLWASVTSASSAISATWRSAGLCCICTPPWAALSSAAFAALARFAGLCSFCGHCGPLHAFAATAAFCMPLRAGGRLRPLPAEAFGADLLCASSVNDHYELPNLDFLIRITQLSSALPRQCAKDT